MRERRIAAGKPPSDPVIARRSAITFAGVFTASCASAVSASPDAALPDAATMAYMENWCNPEGPAIVLVVSPEVPLACGDSPVASDALFFEFRRPLPTGPGTFHPLGSVSVACEGGLCTYRGEATVTLTDFQAGASHVRGSYTLVTLIPRTLTGSFDAVLCHNAVWCM
jgi:hypothetical protein